nr:beta-microseminoprotein-like [Pelodiscus sinensis]|eukprot:XP_006118216.1 beta-microseminoprotein-like [Pelodiscus sinensis]
MKCLLGFLLALGLWVTLCDAYCYFRLNDPATFTKGCLDDGELHKFDSTWISNCHRCYCSQNGIRCCSVFHSPREFDEEKCESIFSKETCTFTVVEKADHSKTCIVQGWAG